jgi:diadenosine tetraphosphate (Ap4A) HIT family hydrolase
MTKHGASITCPFCAMPETKIVAANLLAYSVRDTSPVTPLHTLVLPRRHVTSFFDLNEDELDAVCRIVTATSLGISQMDATVEGFNIGVNVGEIAGQTISHCHVHLIPRRRGDVANPRGGVRAVIPDKAAY